MKLFIVAAGLVAGNFLYQAFSLHNWPIAIERSIFQAVAVYLTGFCLWLSEQKDRTNG